MLPARFEQASFSLVEINNAKCTRPAVSSGMSVGSFPEQRLVVEPMRERNKIKPIIDTSVWEPKRLFIIYN